MLRCALLGHRFRFRADGPTMRWTCQRNCGAGGVRHYRDERTACRCAEAFDREDRAELGRRAPLVGLLPLRLWHRLRRGRHGGD